MAQAKSPSNTAPLRPATGAVIIDLTEIRRVRLLRRLWEDHDREGRGL